MISNPALGSDGMYPGQNCLLGNRGKFLASRALENATSCWLVGDHKALVFWRNIGREEGPSQAPLTTFILFLYLRARGKHCPSPLLFFWLVPCGLLKCGSLICSWFFLGDREALLEKQDGTGDWS